ncbi:uncharacterized protein LOC130774472 [Actinidia eriantha]|uniref:uncharacterized protein LOC130774472 n=1 Tax=Actinidia eriantha TaxID=165200 RepID=UPI00258C2DE1|nr:uncharacterized protein LOC130774472 [Actinidia eriantha]
MTMFDATCSALKKIIDDGNTYLQRGDADSAYDAITSFEFVFILHIIKEIMEITEDLCQALQCKSQDILNAMHLVSTTKVLIQKVREIGWDPLFGKVKLFCEKHDIEILDMSAQYNARRGRSQHQRDQISIKHHFRVDVFIAAIDSQLQELNSRSRDDTMELLILSSALDPRDDYISFNIDNICKLATTFYPQDFTEQEKLHLKYQLQHYELDIHQHYELQHVSTISELCQVWVKTKRSMIYPLVDRLIRLVLTLPVLTATTERVFLAMNLVKTKLRNKIEDDFLANYLITYIEKEIAQDFDTDSIIDEFYCMKERRTQFPLLSRLNEAYSELSAFQDAVPEQQPDAPAKA